MKDRRLKRILISLHVITHWGKNAQIELIKILPPDAVVLRKDDDFETGSVQFIVYSKTFSIIAEGHKLPKIALTPKLEPQEEKLVVNYPH